MSLGSDGLKIVAPFASCAQRPLSDITLICNLPTRRMQFNDTIALALSVLSARTAGRGNWRAFGFQLELRRQRVRRIAYFFSNFFRLPSLCQWNYSRRHHNFRRPFNTCACLPLELSRANLTHARIYNSRVRTTPARGRLLRVEVRCRSRLRKATGNCQNRKVQSWVRQWLSWLLRVCRFLGQVGLPNGVVCLTFQLQMIMFYWLI